LAIFAKSSQIFSPNRHCPSALRRRLGKHFWGSLYRRERTGAPEPALSEAEGSLDSVTWEPPGPPSLAFVLAFPVVNPAGTRTVTAVTFAFQSPCHNRFVVGTAPALKAGVGVCGRRSLWPQQRIEDLMQFAATLTRPSGRLPGRPRETVHNSLQFEGVNESFHSTSSFYFCAISRLARRHTASHRETRNSLQFEGVIDTFHSTSPFYFSRHCGGFSYSLLPTPCWISAGASAGRAARLACSDCRSALLGRRR
jgi:hypothetical protein